MKKINVLKIAAAVLLATTVFLLVFMGLVLKTDVLDLAITAGVFSVFILLMLFMYDSVIKEQYSGLEKSLNKETKYILEESKTGLLSYNADFEISWMSDFFEKRNMDHTGEKILVWLPDLDHLLKSSSISETVVINEDKYLVTKREEDNMLIFRDITREYDLEVKNRMDAYVIGLASYDNYNEITDNEEYVNIFNNVIRVAMASYLKNYDIEYKTLRADRLLLILNEKQYASLLNDRFSILDTVRKEAKKASIPITLSMSFARGTENLVELDSMAYKLMEIAEMRGGDQVATRIAGQDTVFYGGSSEARENQSKIKARAMANSIKGQILKSSNVIIIGHTDADADAIGAALCMSSIVSKLGKQAYIVYEKNSIERMIGDVVAKYHSELIERHTFVTNDQAIEHMDNSTLVLMVDHHSKAQSMGKKVLEYARRIIIIDHHRRMADFDIEPLLVYIEAGASSSVELTGEFLPYLIRHKPMSSLEATIMYLGLVIDTNHFRNRTDARTFEIAKSLKDYGADIRLCESLAREPFELIRKKAEIVGEAYNYADNILIAAPLDGIYPRSIASQASDALMETKTVDAVFVICNTSKEEAIITARSNGNINVQVILEKMNGGGHMTAAGLQSKEKSVTELENELKDVLKEQFRGE